MMPAFWLRYSFYQKVCCGEKTDILELSLPRICKKTDFPANLPRLPLLLYPSLIHSFVICDARVKNSGKKVTCGFLDVALEAEIGKAGFRLCNSSIQQMPMNLP